MHVPACLVINSLGMPRSSNSRIAGHVNGSTYLRDCESPVSIAANVPHHTRSFCLSVQLSNSL
jgi:hypothetical protein